MQQVYFISHPSTGRIKIGHTKDLNSRLTSIATHLVGGLKLIGSMAGGRPLEREIHQQLSEYRLAGEWFNDNEPVRTIVESLLEKGPQAIGYTEPTVDAVETPQWHPERFAVVARALWPTKTAENLAKVLGKSTRQASYFLSGKHECSASDAAAIMSYIFRSR